MVPPIERCAKATIHARQKHAYIDAYLRLWPRNVLRGATPDKRPSLDIVDMHASYGWCYDERDTGQRWEGSAVRAAQCLREYQTTRGKHLILNTYHPDPIELERQSAALEQNIREVIEGAGIKAAIAKHPFSEAVDKIIPHVRRDYPNVWILDPYKPHDMPWSDVEKIIKNVGQRPVKRRGETVMVPRHPELLITFMTSTLQRNVSENPRIVSETLGHAEEDWRPIFDHYVTDIRMTQTDALIQIYGDQLASFYGRRPHVTLVKGAEGNIVYAVFFCTDNDAGFHAMRAVGIPHYEEWQSKKWEATRTEVSEARKEKRALRKKKPTPQAEDSRQPGLSDFF